MGIGCSRTIQFGPIPRCQPDITQKMDPGSIGDGVKKSALETGSGMNTTAHIHSWAGRHV